MSMADRDGFIWYDGKLVPWRDATDVYKRQPLLKGFVERVFCFFGRGEHDGGTNGC